jgi:hypothetical protein
MKSGRTPERFAATGARLDRTKSNDVGMCANYGKTGVKMRRRLNFGPIDGRSGLIQVSYAAIAGIFEET